MLNSDQLGEKGESHFRELCADAGLICNSSNRDRAGWDFTIDFPAPTSDHKRTLDKREGALSCRVQTKTLWLSSERISMRLSSAERLVKEAGPSFIYVMKVHDDLSSYTNYIIHVHGAFADQVLRRLRLEHSRGRKNVNNVTISFDVHKWGTLIPNDGASFRNAAVEAIGSMHTYIENKRLYLNKAGYPENRLQIKTTISAGSIDHLVEGFLGLRELDTVSFEAFETRFNIKLPLAGAPAGSKSTLRIKPHPVDNCTIKLSKGIGRQVILPGKLYVPGIREVPRDLFRVLVRTEAFDFVVYEQRVHLTSRVIPNDGEPRELRFWKSFFVAVDLLQSGAQFQILSTKVPPMSGSIDIDDQGGLPSNLGPLLNTIGHVAHLTEMAGLIKVELTLQELFECGRDAAAAYQRATQPLCNNHVFELEPRADAVNMLPDTFELDMAVPLAIGQYSFGYVARTLISKRLGGEAATWTSDRSEMTDIQLFRSFNEDYERFSHHVRSTSSLSNFGSWVPLPDNASEPCLPSSLPTSDLAEESSDLLTVPHTAP